MEEPPLDDLLDAVPALAVLAGLRLDLFSRLVGAPLTAAELAARIDGDEGRLQALLYALAALELLEVLDAGDGSVRFVCRPLAARCLAADGDDFVGHGHELAVRLWAAGLTVAESIRWGRPTAPHAVGGDAPDDIAAFLRGLHPASLKTGVEMARRGWFDGCRHLVDVGGGSGGVAVSLHRALPEARLTVVERDAVTPCTRQFLDAEGADAVRAVSADLLGDGTELESALGLPCDGVVCVSVLQVLGPHEAAQLVKRVGGWLRPGGRLVIAGIGVLGDDRRSPRDAAVHNILFGTLYEAGRAYTLAEHISWLQDAGFADVRTEWLDDGRGAVRGVRT